MALPRSFPWHSASSAAYHNNTDCKAGKHVEPDALIQGTGGKLLCTECDGLNRAERPAFILRLFGKKSGE